MRIDTRYFGEVDITEEKIIHFEKGLFGFEEYKDYTILYDIESKEEPFFSWLQSTTEKTLAFPIVNPFKIDENYNPVIDESLLATMGECDEEDYLVYLLATVPKEVKDASVNMKAPLIINTRNCQAIQAIAENEGYEIKHKIL